MTTAVLSDSLEFGLLGSCVVCGQSTGWWYRASDRYHPVHRLSMCTGRLAETLTELETIAAGAARLSSAPRRGAWARRGATSAAGTSSPAAGMRYGLSQGSPFHRPGMLEGAPWVAVAQTNFGHLSAPAHVNEAHARSVCRHWRALTDRGWEISPGGVEAVGAMVVDPSGVVVESWGDPFAVGQRRWRPITRLSHWTRCAGCSDVLWPGCLVTVAGGLCVTCTAADEHDDPRVWPGEPSDPGVSARPEHLGGPKRPKTSGRSAEGS